MGRSATVQATILIIQMAKNSRMSAATIHFSIWQRGKSFWSKGLVQFSNFAPKKPLLCSKFSPGQRPLSSDQQGPQSQFCHFCKGGNVVGLLTVVDFLMPVRSVAGSIGAQPTLTSPRLFSLLHMTLYFPVQVQVVGFQCPVGPVPVFPHSLFCYYCSWLLCSHTITDY